METNNKDIIANLQSAGKLPCVICKGKAKPCPGVCMIQLPNNKAKLVFYNVCETCAQKPHYKEKIMQIVSAAFKKIDQKKAIIKNPQPISTDGDQQTFCF